MGYGPIGLCFGIVCGLIADLISRAGGYKSLKCSVASHCVFSLWVIGTMLPMWILGQAYFEPSRGPSRERGLSSTNGWRTSPEGLLVIVVVGIIVCALIGAAIGTKVLRKHFERAGIA